jgi:hypothetical protein
VSGEDQDEVGTYFDQESFRFHCPGGFDDDGRLTEEFVRTDYRSLLRQLGAEGR